LKNLIGKFNKFYKTINLATKSLIIIGIVCLIQTVFSIFLDTNQTSPNDVAIRSVMSSIFGFIFGSQLSENSNVANKNIQTQIALTVSIICLMASIVGHWFHVNEDGAASVEIRNLLFSAVGFILSRAKHLD
jgi:hypothetical protein